MAGTEAFTVNKNDLKSPTNCTSLITGGSSGIGLETAILLHSICPKNNIIVLDRNPPVSAAPSSLTNSPRFLFQKCDLTSWREQRAGFEAGIEKFGVIDNVFVNAGIAEYKDQFFKDDMDTEGKLAEPDRRTIEIDMNAANDTVKLALYHMRHRKDEKKGGSIVMTASLAGYLASAGAPLYSAAKHGKLSGGTAKNIVNERRYRRPNASIKERHRNTQHCHLRCCARYHVDRNHFWEECWRIATRLG